MAGTGGPAPAAVRRRDRLGGREFRLRAISGLVMAVAVVAGLVVGEWPFAVIWLVAAVIATGEWIAMTQLSPTRPLVAVTAAALVGAVVCARVGTSPATIAMVLAGAGLVLLIVARDSATRVRALLGLGGGAVIALVPTALRDDPAIGIVGPAWMFAVVWSTDIVAYVTGRMLGGPKLMPRVSPNKTWSGALGGLAAGTLAGAGLVMAARAQGWSGAASASLGIVALASAAASICSQSGDLAESALKRRWGVKDSGRSIPGHGGVMDRLDGFFAVAVLVGFYLVLRRLAAA
ncbi:phosphatidate cytidylyltransferase [Methylobacterium sp. Leaf466]|uniref:phosphatidate cytidylyltransferase n=1 Tax=Methylobacterium sp. Leaf466 TaxID=1736386 RepID=UPI0006F8814E|nr:phosphatidate cytidylyltransferase [Methylobacterium sp. Leaf466]KQT78178.1 phosphatidate cytidylyltransferase [Methylobacterium sp. Leaf466]